MWFPVLLQFPLKSLASLPEPFHLHYCIINAVFTHLERVCNEDQCWNTSVIGSYNSMKDFLSWSIHVISHCHRIPRVSITKPSCFRQMFKKKKRKSFLTFCLKWKMKAKDECDAHIKASSPSPKCIYTCKYAVLPLAHGALSSRRYILKMFLDAYPFKWHSVHLARCNSGKPLK